MSLLSFLRRAPAQKQTRTAPLVALSTPGRPVFTPTADARRAFSTAVMRNPVAMRAIKRLAQAVAEIPFQVSDATGGDASHHLAARLMAQPNPDHERTAFLEALVTHLIVTGNAFVEAVSLGADTRELHVLRPDRMRLVTGEGGRIAAYDYTVGDHSVRFVQEGLVPPILHIKLPQPFDDHFGLAPLDAAYAAIDIHNAATAWTKALLDNAARPSGALVYSGGDGALTEDQYERLKKELEEGFAGARNAGRPLLLEGGLDWKPLSLSPKDMDFMEAKNGAAREIALAIGVPPLVLGIPGDATYSNFQEANRALYRDAALPLARRIAGALAAWLAPGEALQLSADEDAIGALGPDRESLWRRVDRASFLTEGEKREAVGYSRNKPEA